MSDHRCILKVLLAGILLLTAGTEARDVPGSFPWMAEKFKFRYGVSLYSWETSSQVWQGIHDEQCNLKVIRGGPIHFISEALLFETNGGNRSFSSGKGAYLVRLTGDGLSLEIKCENLRDYSDLRMMKVFNTFGRFPNFPRSFEWQRNGRATFSPYPEPRETCADRLATFCFLHTNLGELYCGQLCRPLCAKKDDIDECIPTYFHGEYEKIKDLEWTINIGKAAIENSAKRCLKQ